MPDIDNRSVVEAVMRDLQEVLLTHLGGVLPDVVLIVRLGEICRTTFAANPMNFKPDENPREVMTQILETAVIQNREVNAGILKSGRQ